MMMSCIHFREPERTEVFETPPIFWPLTAALLFDFVMKVGDDKQIDTNCENEVGW